MARTRTQLTSVEQWSCPLCTLLNAAADDRCMACDNARLPAEKLRKYQPPIAPAGAATTSNVFRHTSGVFFSSLPQGQVESGATTAWRQEPRLVVNRRRGYKWRKAIADEEKVESEQVETGALGQNLGFTRTERDAEQDTEANGAVQRKDIAVEATEVTEQTQERQEEEDTALDVEEPCFNLLGSGAAVFAAPEQEHVLEDPCPTDETKSRDGSEEVDFGLDQEQEVEAVEPPPRYPGFMPASKVVVDEPAIENKLASAGLDLSDSDDEEGPKTLRRAKDDSWEDKWVCHICTNMNDQIALECTSCMCKRYQDDPAPKDTPAASNLRWACHICSFLNPPELTDCQMCFSTRKPGAQAASSSPAERWRCSVCTSSNAPDTTRCEACARVREAQPKQVTRMRPECPVCTNVNAPGSTRCELCDSSLQPEEGENDFVDLSSSPPDRNASYTVEESDLENPYADLSQYNDYAAPNDDADRDDDYVEDISDNERPTFSSSTRPVVRRADLREFEHFVSMEDLRRDYGCSIDYSKMFAGQRSRKSYADRLATRKAESRKRLRTAAQKAAGGTSTSSSRGGKAARGSKKRKAPASSRRASGSSAKAPRAKRAKKNGATARRASSATATTFSPGINHYDDSAGADLGGDLATMAWEGVGSAGYL